MSNVSAKKVFIQIESAEEQQEHIRKQRKTLKVLQGVATDKENLGQQPDKLSRLKAASDVTLASVDHGKRKKIETRTIETQTSPVKEKDNAKTTITAEDLTSTSKPGEHYFERLAEKRRQALESALIENRTLHERYENREEEIHSKDERIESLEEEKRSLQEELITTRQLLEEAHSLVEVLKEMLNEEENEEKLDDDSDTRSSTEPTAETK